MRVTGPHYNRPQVYNYDSHWTLLYCTENHWMPLQQTLVMKHQTLLQFILAVRAAECYDTVLWLSNLREPLSAVHSGCVRAAECYDTVLWLREPLSTVHSGCESCRMLWHCTLIKRATERSSVMYLRMWDWFSHWILFQTVSLDPWTCSRPHCGRLCTIMYANIQIHMCIQSYMSVYVCISNCLSWPINLF